MKKWGIENKYFINKCLVATVIRMKSGFEWHTTRFVDGYLVNITFLLCTQSHFETRREIEHNDTSDYYTSFFYYENI